MNALIIPAIYPIAIDIKNIYKNYFITTNKSLVLLLMISFTALIILFYILK